MREDDIKVIANLGDWSNSDKLLSRLLYEKYGRVLEQKLGEFQECKAELKECIKKNFGESVVPRTPKRVKPMASLLDQIHRFKTISFDADDVENSPSRVFESPTPAANGLQTPAAIPQKQDEQMISRSVRAEIEKMMVVEEPNPYIFNEPNEIVNSATASTSSTLGRGKMVTRSKYTTKKTTAKIPTQSTAKSPANKVPRPSVRQQKIKLIEEKTNQALKSKEDHLKEKAERTKRDREEHRQRVEQNNRIKEAEQKERERQAREQDRRLLEFRMEQEKTASVSKSPFRAGLAVASVLSKNTPRHIAIQPKTTPRQLIIPAKRSKNMEEDELVNDSMETDNAERIQEEERERKRLDQERLERELHERELLEEQRRKQEELEAKRQEDERIDEERAEQERRELDRQDNQRREQELAEQQRKEQELAEQQRKEQKRLERERIEKERRELEQREKVRREQELREKKEQHLREKKEQQLREQQKIIEKEQQERDKKFRAAVNYDMTPDKVFIPSTQDNYNVDDLSSNDETDNDEKPRKDVPKWAQKNQLTKRVTALRRLLPEESRERHFGKMVEPDISAFFKNQQKKYPLRSSSAVWTSPMSDPTPGVGRFLSYQVGARR